MSKLPFDLEAEVQPPKHKKCPKSKWKRVETVLTVEKYNFGHDQIEVCVRVLLDNGKEELFEYDNIGSKRSLDNREDIIALCNELGINTLNDAYIWNFGCFVYTTADGKFHLMDAAKTEIDSELLRASAKTTLKKLTADSKKQAIVLELNVTLFFPMGTSMPVTIEPKNKVIFVKTSTISPIVYIPLKSVMKAVYMSYPFPTADTFDEWLAKVCRVCVADVYVKETTDTDMLATVLDTAANMDTATIVGIRPVTKKVRKGKGNASVRYVWRLLQVDPATVQLIVASKMCVYLSAIPKPAEAGVCHVDDNTLFDDTVPKLDALFKPSAENDETAAILQSMTDLDLRPKPMTESSTASRSLLKSTVSKKTIVPERGTLSVSSRRGRSARCRRVSVGRRHTSAVQQFDHEPDDDLLMPTSDSEDIEMKGVDEVKHVGEGEDVVMEDTTTYDTEFLTKGALLERVLAGCAHFRWNGTTEKKKMGYERVAIKIGMTAKQSQTVRTALRVASAFSRMHATFDITQYREADIGDILSKYFGKGATLSSHKRYAGKMKWPKPGDFGMKMWDETMKFRVKPEPAKKRKKRAAK